MTPTLLQKLEQLSHRNDIGLDLSVYRQGTLEAILSPISRYLSAPLERPRTSGGWFSWKRAAPAMERVSPLLLAGPVGTGKTTLMMLLDRALPEASCAPLFQQEIAGHSSTDETGRGPILIEVRPLSLMGYTHNVPTGVIRLRDLQTFYRLYTYDRGTASVDEAAAELFAQFFHKRIVFIDEFVPDTVTSFPMTVINHLANHGVLVVLSSNRRETPFVEGVQVVPVEGDDMRSGDLARVLRPAGERFGLGDWVSIPVTALDHVARSLRGQHKTVDGLRWMRLAYDNLSRAPADWLAFQRLLQLTDGVLVDEVPLFDPERGGSSDAARRFVYLIDALYDERRPVLVRITNESPLPNDFDVETLASLYLPETLLDLERALSRLRQLSTLVTPA